MTLSNAASSSNEIVTTRRLAASPEMVWGAWTDPERLTRWWGPRGFTTTTHELDMRPGGVWRFTMHGPDGRDYANRIEYVEVDAPRRLVYRHAGEGADEKVRFDTTIVFQPVPGGTDMTFRMVFATADERDAIEKEYGAAEGLRATVERLGEHMIAWRSGPRGDFQVLKCGEREIRLARSFAAPKSLVYQAITRPEHVRRWWGGCQGMEMTVCEMDFRVGGTWRFVLRTSAGDEHPFRGEYREIVPEARISQTFVYDVPFIRDHPSLETMTLEERDGRTWMTVVVEHASRESRDGHFDSGMEAGARASYEALAAIVEGAAR
jgi:uncharacterized protein YndB with AHSA1/START domain